MQGFLVWLRTIPNPADINRFVSHTGYKVNLLRTLGNVKLEYQANKIIKYKVSTNYTVEGVILFVIIIGL